MLERLQEAIVLKSKRLMDVPPEIREAWEKTRTKIRIVRRLSVVDVPNPWTIYAAGVRRGRDAIIDNIIADAESLASTLLFAAASITTDSEEEIELDRGPA